MVFKAMIFASLMESLNLMNHRKLCIIIMSKIICTDYGFKKFHNFEIEQRIP